MIDIQITDRDIKRSVEYRYHMRAVKRILLVWFAIILLISIPRAVDLLIHRGFPDAWWRILLFALLVLCAAGLPLGIIALGIYGRARALLRNRARLIPCIVTLTEPIYAYCTAGVTSYYFNAFVVVGDAAYSTRTNALFSDSPLGYGFKPNDFASCSVLALFDKDANRVYVIEKL